jgi:hypothetical protein
MATLSPLASGVASGAVGTLFTPGPIVTNGGDTPVVKISNLNTEPLSGVTVLAVGNNNVIEFQQTFQDIQPFQTVDAALPPPRDRIRWLPAVFVPDSQTFSENEFFDVFFDLDIFEQTRPQMRSVKAQYLNRLWRKFERSEFLPPDTLRFGPSEPVESLTPGPIDGSGPGNIFVIAVKNLGGGPLRAFGGCLDRSGQTVRGCDVQATIPGNGMVVVPIQPPQQFVPFLCLPDGGSVMLGLFPFPFSFPALSASDHDWLEETLTFHCEEVTKER